MLIAGFGALAAGWRTHGTIGGCCAYSLSASCSCSS
jgi:hypothetical protein